MHEPKYQIEKLAPPAKVPDSFTKVHPDLNKGHEKWTYIVSTIFVAIIGLGLGPLAYAWNPVYGALIGLFFIACAFAMAYSGKIAQDNMRYSTWISETVTPVPAKIELEVFYVDDSGNDHCKAKIVVKSSVAIYEAQNPLSKSDPARNEMLDCMLYQDPVNQSAVLATIGEKRIWLRELAIITREK